jgi:hypothetical protein
MVVEYPYLVMKEGRPGARVVEADLTLADLATRPVIRDESTNTYLVFDSRDEFHAWYAELPEPRRSCHEVIFGQLPQRLKFDVDAPSLALEAFPEAELGASGGMRPRPAPAGAAQAQVLLPGAVTALALACLDEYFGVTSDLLDGAAAPPAPAGPAPQADPDDALRRLNDRKARAIVDRLIEAVLDELYVGYNGHEDLRPERGDLAITDSSGPTPEGWKYSYHVIVLPYAVLDHYEAREFTARVVEALPPAYRDYVDTGVNNDGGCFRLAGSAKPGTGRYKRATAEAARTFGTAAGLSERELLITAAPGARVLARVYCKADGARARRPRAALGERSPAVRAMLDLAGGAGVLRGHVFREARGSLLCFDRAEPSHCRICGETHHRDNSLMLGLAPAGAGGGYRVVEYCRQARGRSFTVGELALSEEDLRGADPQAALRLPRERAEPRRGEAGREPRAADVACARSGGRLAERVAAVRAGRADPHAALASAFERLPAAQQTVYSEPQMRDYELVPTLAVRAQMKLGKTKALRRYLDAYFPAAGLTANVVRFVTFRQTFGRALAEAFPDFTLYSDVAGDLDAVQHPRLIVQVESLHRLRLGACPAPVDLLVLDEAESVLSQFGSGLHRQFTAAFAAFQWMLRTARHVVCLDANLGDRAFRTLGRMRPAHPPHFHWNRHARAAGDAYYLTADQGAWLEELYARLRAGQRVVLPTNSLAEARAYEENLRRAFPQKRVRLYSSETPPSEKARHFGDVRTHWGDLDVLIFTPTCSAGVSFEEEHYDVLFGFFGEDSCDVETCRQMMARVRHLRAREHYVCLRAPGRHCQPTDPDEIGRLVRDKRAGLYRGVEDVALHFEYADDGTPCYRETDAYHLWVENLRVANLSRNEFARRFVDQVADTGAGVELLPPRAGPELGAGAALLADHRGTQDRLKAARCAAVAAAADLAPDDAAAVREALQAQQDVAPGDRLAYEKYMLREAYGWHGRPVDAAFVARYRPAAVRRVYRNLCQITEGPSVRASLRLLQQREAHHYAYVAAAGDHAGVCRDLLRDRTTYVSRAHLFAVWLLGLCGFSFAGGERVHEAALAARLRAALPALGRMLARLVFEFEVQRPNLGRLALEADRRQFLGGALRFVNTVLRLMYGRHLARATRRAGGACAGAYVLDLSPVGRLFVFSRQPEPDDTPGGPRPHIPSNLAEAPAADGGVRLFMEEVFYGESADDSASGEGPDPDPDEEPASDPDEDLAALED